MGWCALPLCYLVNGSNWNAKARYSVKYDPFYLHIQAYGGLMLSLAWVFVVLGDTYDSSTLSWNLNRVRFIRTPDFWLVWAMTVSYVLSLLALCDLLRVPM